MPTRAERRRAARAAARRDDPGAEAPGPAAPFRPRDDARARMGRRVALTLAGIAVLWFCTTLTMGALGIGVRWMVLVDLAAGAGFAWVLFQTWRLRRR